MFHVSFKHTATAMTTHSCPVKMVCGLSIAEMYARGQISALLSPLLPVF